MAGADERPKAQLEQLRLVREAATAARLERQSGGANQPHHASYQSHQPPSRRAMGATGARSMQRGMSPRAQPPRVLTPPNCMSDGELVARARRGFGSWANSVRLAPVC
jgi:hypothetical protein